MEAAVVEVVTVSRRDDVATIAVRLESGDLPSDPIAPAGLYAGDHAEDERAQLHKLIAKSEDGVLEFESYGNDNALPAEGDRLVLRAWWRPEAWEAVADRGRVWQRRRFDEGDHDHCLLTWETIRPGDEGYRSDAGEWISITAYEQFVRDDLLRNRR